MELIFVAARFLFKWNQNCWWMYSKVSIRNSIKEANESKKKERMIELSNMNSINLLKYRMDAKKREGERKRERER